MATDAGVRICAPIHDAVLIEANDGALEETVATMQRCMTAASRLMLNDFALQTSVTRIRYPDRFTDARGERVWRLVLQALQSRVPASVWTTAAGAAPARG